MSEPPVRKPPSLLTFVAGCLTGMVVLWLLGLVRLGGGERPQPERPAASASGAGTGMSAPAAEGEPGGPGAGQASPPARYPYRLVGRVVDADGNGVVGATVRAFGREDLPPMQAQCDGEGAFEIDSVPLGLYTVEARASGFVTASLQGVTPDTLDLELLLETSGQLTGQVVRDGAGVAGATVLIGGAGVFPAEHLVSDAGGHFSLDRPSTRGHLALAAFTEDAGSGFGAVVSPADSHPVTLELHLAESWAFTVTDAATQAPIEHGLVSISSGAVDLLAVAEEVHDGRAVFTGLPAGTYYVRVRSPGYLPWGGTLDHQADTPAAVALDQGAMLSVTVLDGALQPVGGVRLEPSIRDELGGRWQLVPDHDREVDRFVRTDGSFVWAPPYAPATDDTGNAFISGLPRGRVVIRADHPGFEPFESEPLSTDGASVQALEIQLTPGQ